MILVDTGPIVAVVNDRDDRHRECRHLLERRRGTYAELAFLCDVRARGTR